MVPTDKPIAGVTMAATKLLDATEFRKPARNLIFSISDKVKRSPLASRPQALWHRTALKVIQVACGTREYQQPR